MAATDAKAIPIKNTAYRVTFPILDADGDFVTGATGLDSEVSIDGGTFADATSEATEIAAASGMYFLDLTAGEMNGDTIAIIVKTSSTGAKTTPIVLYTAARSINDLAFPTVSGRSLDVSTTGEAGVDWANVGSPTTTQNLSGTSTKAVEPTVAGRTLDVSTGGEAGLDWANIGSPTTAQNLSGTSTKAVEPTVAGRTLDVTTTGEAGIDWANVGAPTTALALTNTTIATTQKVDLETIKTNPVVNAGTITFPTAATLASTTNIAAGTVTTATNVTTVNGLAANVITATSINADAITAAKIADGAIDRATFAVDTGLQPIRSSTAQAGAATTITLDASASASDSFYNNALILLTGGTGAGQSRFITAYVGSTKVATVATWVVNPDATSTFAILPFDAVAGASAPTAAQVATAVWQDLLAGSDFATASSIGKLLKDDIDATITSRMATYTQPTGFLAATFPSGTIANTTNITAGTIATATNVTTVNGLAANVITAASIAADAIGASELAADAVTEIQAGLATAAALATVQSDTDDIQTRLPAALVGGRIDASVGAMAANVLTAAALADAAIDRAAFASDTGLQPIRSNTAQAGAATTITLDAGASASDSFYNNALILLTGGTGAGQARFITAYVGSSKVATVATWVTNPDVTSTFAILPFDAVAGASAPTAAQVATTVWQDLLAGSDFTTASSIGKLLKDDIDATVTSRMATYAQPTGFLTATFPSGTVANTTNITAGIITTTTNLTTNNDKTGYGLSAAAIQAIWDALTSVLTTVGSIGKKLADWTVGTIDTYTGNTKQTGDAFVRLGAPVGASISVDIAGVQADTDNLQTRVPTILVGGRMDSSVGAMTAGVITAAVVATDALDADALAADAVAEIQAGLATAAALATVQADTDDLQTRIPTTLSGGRMRTDVEALVANTTAATTLRQSLIGAITGAAVAGTLSTTQMTTDLTSATDGFYNGRLVTWTSGVLTNQQSEVTAYLGSTKRVTYTAVTNAPSAGDAFVLT